MNNLKPNSRTKTPNKPPLAVSIAFSEQTSSKNNMVHYPTAKDSTDFSPEPHENPQSLWTAQKIADYLSVSKSLVYRWVQENKIPYIRIGKTIRFSFPEIKEWLNSKSQPQIQSNEKSIDTDIDKLLMSTRIGSKV